MENARPRGETTRYLSQKDFSPSIREAEFRALIEAFDGLIYVCSPDYRIEYLNEAMIRRIGRNATGELCYKALHDLEEPCNWCVRDKIDSGEKVTWEVRSPKDDRWFHIVNVPIFQPDGRVGKMALIRDITEQKRVEEKLVESERKYRLLVDNQANMVVKMLPDGRLQFVNPAFLEVMPGDAASHIGQPFAACVHPDDRDDFQTAFDSLPHPPHHAALDLRMDVADGAPHWFNWSFTRTHREGDNGAVIVGMGRDITRRKDTERALQYFRKAVETSTDAIGMSTPEGRHYYQNPAFDKLFGMGVEEVGTLAPPACIYADPGQGRVVFKTIMAGGEWTGEIRMRDKAGREFDAFLRAYSIKDDQGKVLGLVGMHTDITDRKQAQLEAERSRNFLHAVINALDEPFFVKDESHRWILLNDASVKAMGRPREELIGKTDADLFPPDQVEVFLRGDLEAMRTGRDIREEKITWGGEDHTILTSKYRYEEPGTGRRYLVGTIRDITDRIRAEEAIRRSEKRFRTLFNASSVAMLIHDPLTGSILDANPAAYRMYGLVTVEELRSYEYWHEPPYSRADADAWIKKAVREGTQDFQWCSRTRSGVLIWEQVRLSPIEIAGEERVLAVCIDCTERKRAEDALRRTNESLETRVRERTAELETAAAALRRSEEQFKSLVNNIPGTTYRCRYDPDWTMLFMSSDVNLLTGYPTADFLRNAVRSFQSVIHPGDTLRVSQVISSAVRAGSTWEVEYRLLHRDGGIRWAFEKGRAIRNAAGEVDCLDGFILDITERKNATLARKAAEDALVHSERLAAVGMLAGSVAHEFNNINTSVLGFAELLTEDPTLTEDQHEFAERIRKASLRAANMANNLLSFSKPRKSAPAAANLIETIEDTLSLVERSFETAGITIHREFTRVPITVYDEAQIGQVLLNLLINARHALTDAQTKEITVKTGMEGKTILLHVSDTGCGIPSDVLPEIFKPFFTTKGDMGDDPGSQPKVVGTGLGLSVCQTILANHNGDIRVSSVPGIGTTFTVSLPVIKPSVRAFAGKGGADNAAPAKKRTGRILVVDDEEDTRMLLQHALRRDGHHVDIIGDGATALERLRETAYDVMLMDLQMTRMGGVELLATLHADPAITAPGVIVISGCCTIQVQEMLSVHPVSGIIQKPFELSDIQALVADALREGTP